MNIFFQVLATVASIVSVPLAIFFYVRTSKITSDKARSDIIRTLSYKLGTQTTLTEDDIIAIYNSKLREHKIKRPDFNKKDIVDDLKSEIMSNPFLDTDTRNRVLTNLYGIDIYTPHIDSRKIIIERVFLWFMESPLYWILTSLTCICFVIFTMIQLPRAFDGLSHVTYTYWDIINSIIICLFGDPVQLCISTTLLVLIGLRVSYKLYRRYHVIK